DHPLPRPAGQGGGHAADRGHDHQPAGRAEPAGGWDYTCVQAFTAEERKLISDEAAGNVRELKAARDLSKLPAKGKRVATDLPKVIQVKMVIVAKGGTNNQVHGVVLGDNSNTQFATLALWAGRRYGVPTQEALKRTEARFRTSQATDGTWGYVP